MNSSAESSFAEDKMPLKKGNEEFLLLWLSELNLKKVRICDNFLPQSNSLISPIVTLFTIMIIKGKKERKNARATQKQCQRSHE